MSTLTPRAVLLRRIVADFEQRVNTFLDYAEAHPRAGFTDLEGEARQVSRDVVVAALAAVVEERRAGAEATARCACGHRLLDTGEQPRSQETAVGRLRWWRRYVYCLACQRGWYPLDEALGIGPGPFSDGVQAGAARLGAAVPFAAAADTFTALTGVRITDRAVARITEGRGALLETHVAAERARVLDGRASAPVPRRPAGPGMWAVSLDAAKARFTDGWHESNAGVVFRARPAGDPDQPERTTAAGQRSLATVGAMDEAGARRSAEAVRRGIDPAEERVVCLGDGAPGNGSQFAEHFPRRVEVVDW